MSVNGDRGSPDPYYLLNFGFFIRGVFQEPKLVAVPVNNLRMAES
jgi:hypothetical protein